MKSRKVILRVIILVCVGLLPTLLYAAYPDRVRSQQSTRTGLYRARIGEAVKDYVSFTVDALYYYGDVEGQGFMPVEQPLHYNVSVGGTVNYHQTIAPQWNMRYTLGGGWLQAYYGGPKATYPREFDSGYARVAIGVEWFPIYGEGFYIYAGVIGQYNHIHFKMYENEETKLPEYDDEEDNFYPLIPIEIGYNFKVADNWQVGVHLGIVQGLFESRGYTLDAWPARDEKYDFGTTASNKYPDGHWQLGFSVAYSWNKF